MKNNKCVILIPIYKENPYFDEYISILNTYNLYNDKYDIFFICKDTLNVTKYKKFFNIDFIISDFYGALSYSSMLRSYKFYEQFLQYEYMLIVQTDAYVFNGYPLEYFLSKKYPYLGAFIEGNILPKFLSKHIFDNAYKNNYTIKDLVNEINKNKYINDINGNDTYMLNGGLSLRNNKIFYTLYKEYQHYTYNAEDLNISHLLNKYNLSSNILVRDIINFSYEHYLLNIYKKYNIIPFGSHQEYRELFEIIEANYVF